MAESARAMAYRLKDIEVRLAVDMDDALIALYPSPHLINKVKRPIAPLYNELARGAGGELLMVVGDDVMFRTSGWDEKVIEVAKRFPDGLFIAAPDNGDGKERVNHWCTGRQWLDLFGWVHPEHFEHFSADEWVQEVAKPCGRLVYMRDVLLEHMHKKYKKSPNDATYDSKREKAADGSSMSSRDQLLFAKLAPERAADIEKLRSAIQ